jgi:hypothetical protein
MKGIKKIKKIYGGKFFTCCTSPFCTTFLIFCFTNKIHKIRSNCTLIKLESFCCYFLNNIIPYTITLLRDLSSTRCTTFDSRVYTNTSLYNISRTDAVDPWEPFPGAVVLADSAYLGIRNDGLLLPHPRHNRLNPENAAFYQAHRNARNNVECVIGRLKGKFSILSTTRGRINTRSRLSASRIIAACCMLYNFIQLEKGLADEGEDHDDFQELDLLECLDLILENDRKIIQKVVNFFSFLQV